MVDVTYSPESSTPDLIEEIIPEDNVERLRNIRDMFESSNYSEELILQKVEKLQPSEKLIDRLTKFEEGVVENAGEEEDEENEEQQTDGIIKNRRVQKKKDVIPFAELNNVKTKFEKYSEQSNDMPTTPKPIRCITPPPEGTNTGEIENQPMQRQDDVVSSDAKFEDKLPDAGNSRSRKELFESIGTEQSMIGKGELPRVKSITPPREDALKRVLKETTPERNENVTRESDRSDDILPTAGHIKNTAAMFANGRQKSIERSGITLEGELLEKGIAKQRLALFQDPSALNTASHAPSTAELESEYIKNVSGIAKERLSLFKNLEQNVGENRTSPSRELKKLKEFTPPPQLDHPQRQYIIINEDDDKSKTEVFQDEALAAIGRGHAKSALAKFEQSVAEASSHVRKSITPPKDYLKAATSGAMKTVFESQPLESNVNAQFIEEDIIPSAGNAKSLKDKFLNLEKEAAKIETASSKMTYLPKKFTAPSTNQSEQQKQPKQAAKPKGNGLLTTASNAQGSQNGSTAAAAGEKCCVCEKTVYAMEKIEADKKVYHKTCFKCTSCNCQLNDTTDLASYLDDKPYCLKDAKKLEPPPAPSPQASPKKTAKPMEAIKVDTSASGSKSPSKASPAAAAPAAPASSSPAASPSKKSAVASPAKSPKK